MLDLGVLSAALDVMHLLPAIDVRLAVALFCRCRPRRAHPDMLRVVYVSVLQPLVPGHVRVRSLQLPLLRRKVRGPAETNTVPRCSRSSR